MKGGRPPVPADERLSVQVTVRFTPAEADLIYSAATRHGVDAAPLLRRLILRQFERTT